MNETAQANAIAQTAVGWRQIEGFDGCGGVGRCDPVSAGLGAEE
ncbi:hypothetical protein ACFWHR_03365 [Leucobacter sp. NPDC058333]